MARMPFHLGQRVIVRIDGFDHLAKVTAWYGRPMRVGVRMADDELRVVPVEDVTPAVEVNE